MKIQVNSDKSIAVHGSLTQFVEREVNRILGRFAARLTRVEVHLCDVDNKKTGKADKRCMIEARPAGAPPRTATANATRIASAVDEALGKMQRSLTTFFGRRERPAVEVSTPLPASRKSSSRKSVARKVVALKAVVRETTKGAQPSAAVKKAPLAKPVKLTTRGPKKKRIYQARREPWPAR